LPPTTARNGMIGRVQVYFPRVTADGRRTVDDRALHVVGRRVAVVREQYRDRSGDDGRAHRGAGTTEIGGVDAGFGVLRIDRGSGCTQRNERHAGRDDFGLGVADDSPAARPARHGVVVGGRGTHRVGGTDGDDIGVVARRAHTVVAVVSGRGDDGDSRCPSGFGCRVERVQEVRHPRIEAERQVEHPDVVGVAIRDDPADARDHA
jgi:hypothetical protein